jgi:hypothetical protein
MAEDAFFLAGTEGETTKDRQEHRGNRDRDRDREDIVEPV